MHPQCVFRPYLLVVAAGSPTWPTFAVAGGPQGQSLRGNNPRKEQLQPMEFLLIAGLWLDGSAWDAVVPQLRALGHQAVPVWLPGQGKPPAAATLADQQAAVLAAVGGAAGKGGVV